MCQGRLGSGRVQSLPCRTWGRFPPLLSRFIGSLVTSTCPLGNQALLVIGKICKLHLSWAYSPGGHAAQRLLWKTNEMVEDLTWVQPVHVWVFWGLG